MRPNALIAVCAVSLIGVLAACQAVMQKQADMPDASRVSA